MVSTVGCAMRIAYLHNLTIQILNGARLLTYLHKLGIYWSTKGAGIQVERGCGGDWGIMQPARSISATFERGYGKLPKDRGYGWILVLKVLSANCQRGHGRNLIPQKPVSWAERGFRRHM